MTLALFSYVRNVICQMSVVLNFSSFSLRCVNIDDLHSFFYCWLYVYNMCLRVMEHQHASVQLWILLLVVRQFDDDHLSPKSDALKDVYVD